MISKYYKKSHFIHLQPYSYFVSSWIFFFYNLTPRSKIIIFDRIVHEIEKKNVNFHTARLLVLDYNKS